MTDVRPLTPPDVRRRGDDFVFQWGPDLIVVMTRLHETTAGTQGEISITHGDRSLHWGRLTLSSTSQREELIRKLGKTNVRFQWREAIDEICRSTAEAFRDGRPAQTLQPRWSEPQYLVETLLPKGKITVLFGPGGSGKSYFALAVAAAVAAGRDLPNGLRVPTSGRVLYADWEDDIDEAERRLYQVLAGFGLTELPHTLQYLRQDRHLAHEIERLRRKVAAEQITLVVIDSNMAAGAEDVGNGRTLGSAANAFMDLLRSLQTTVLVLAHVNKLDLDRKNGTSRAYGSSYHEYRARSMWEFRAEENVDADAWRFGLYNTKRNVGRKSKPLGFSIAFRDRTVVLSGADVMETPDLAARTTVAARILHELKTGPTTAPDLADRCDLDKTAVRVELHRLRKRRGTVMTMPDGTWALASERKDDA